MTAEGYLDVLLEEGHSPQFHAALKRLVLAYRADIEAARLESPAHKQKGCVPGSAEVTDAPWSGGAGQGAGGTCQTSSQGANLEAAGDCDDALPISDGKEHPEVQSAPGTAGALATEAGKRSRDLQHLTGESHHKSTMEHIVHSIYFEAVSIAILTLFCLFAGLDMQQQGQSLGHHLGWSGYTQPEATGWAEVGPVLSSLMVVCGVLFALEVMFRVVALRLNFFRDSWNYFDVVVLLSVVLELFGSRLLGDVSALKNIRILRLMRFFTMFRFIQRLDALHFLMKAIFSSLRMLASASVMLIVVQALTAFMITQFLFTFYFPDTSKPLDEKLKVFEYFGSFSRSLLTTFEMSLGNWPVPARVLFENVSEWFMVVSILHKVTVGFSVIGIINAVYVQETMQLATSDDILMVKRKRKQASMIQQKLDRLFRAADHNGNGSVSREEFKSIVGLGDIRVWLSSMDFDCKDPDLLFDLLDDNEDGEITSRGFFEGMTKLRGPSRAMDMLSVVEELRQLRGRMSSPQHRLSRRGTAALVVPTW